MRCRSEGGEHILSTLYDILSELNFFPHRSLRGASKFRRVDIGEIPIFVQEQCNEVDLQMVWKNYRPHLDSSKQAG